MPTVGKKKFPYTADGMIDAKAAAKKSGKEVKEKESKTHERTESASARMKEYGSKTGGMKKVAVKKKMK